MKKWLIFVLCILCLNLVGCKNENNNINNEIFEDGSDDNNVNNTLDTWGVARTHANSNEIGNGGYEIKFPYLIGIPEVSGLVGYQGDGTRVIVDGEMWGLSPKINGVKDVFPAYFEQTIAILDTYYTPNYSNFKFTVDDQEFVEINGYEMCKYNGVNTFVVDGKNIEYHYVAYATLLHSNNGVVYWMVLDESEDQSLNKTIESHAYNMALSLEEY